MTLIPVLTPDQSAAWDRAAECAGIDLATLMETAGRACAAIVADRYGPRLSQGVLVAAGLGNNGGDGWVLARALHRLDVPVWVASLDGDGSPLRRRMAGLARADGVRDVAPDGPWPSVGLVVDALLGTGASGAPRPAMATLLQRSLDLAVPVVAIDGPTGLDLLTGVSHGAPRADLTITFGGLRRGHLLARDEVGDLVVVDIGHPPPAEPSPLLLTDPKAAELLPPFAAAAHKGVRGRVVVVGGAPGMSGALRMAGRAAFAAGAGLVHVVAPAESIAAIRAAEPPLQTLAHELEGEPSAELGELLGRADVVVVGPGLGRAEGRRAFVANIVARAGVAVLDADALVVFQGAADALCDLAAARPLVLTPHPGEFRTLFPDHAARREVDPWGAAEAAAAACGAVVLLKGVPTVVAQEGRASITVAAGNPGLATGGSGDVLSGLVATALAQGVEPLHAAAVAAHALGRAADLGARRVTARALRPMDVIASLGDLWREWGVLRAVRPVPRPPMLLDLPRPRSV